MLSVPYLFQMIMAWGGHGLDLDLPHGSLDLNASFHFHVLVLRGDTAFCFSVPLN